MQKLDTLIAAARSGRYFAAGALNTRGGTIYSYALPLAEVQDGAIVALPGMGEKISVTTSRHQRQIAAYIG